MAAIGRQKVEGRRKNATHTIPPTLYGCIGARFTWIRRRRGTTQTALQVCAAQRDGVRAAAVKQLAGKVCREVAWCAV